MPNHKQTNGRHEGDVLKGLAAGIVGGLVASWTMNQFQTLWSKFAEEGGQSQDEKSSRQEGEGNGGQKKSESKGSDEGEDVAGPAVHYAMGATSGAIYGAMAEVLPLITVGAGLAFGTAVWLVADEAAVPALGLSESPTEVPLSKHAYALASHFVYGLTEGKAMNKQIICSTVQPLAAGSPYSRRPSLTEHGP